MRDYFRAETRLRSWANGLKPNDVQISRWEWMRDHVLNPIRNHVKSPVKITSCLRNQASYDRLLNQGYHPSQKSDHFAGTPIALTREKDIKRFGKFYTFSTFACDIVGDFDYKELCRDVFITLSRHDIYHGYDSHSVIGLSEFGVEQIILESQIMNGNEINWIHVSAPLEAFYSRSEARVVRKIRNKIRFLEFKNNIYSQSEFR